VNEIVRRHEALRTGIEMVEGRPVQRVRERCHVPLPITDLSSLHQEAQSSELEQLLVHHATLPFDLLQPPLFRMRIFLIAAGEYVLLLNFHHLVCDGWSAHIFLRELMTLYEGRVLGKPSLLPSLPIQYSDYAVWQQNNQLVTNLNYWKDQLSGAAPFL